MLKFIPGHPGWPRHSLVALIVISITFGVLGCRNESSNQRSGVASSVEASAIDGEPTVREGATLQGDEQSDGCDQTSHRSPSDDIETGDGLTRTHRINGVDREYLIDIPKHLNSSDPMPVIINFHGHDGNASIANKVSELPELATQRGYVVLAPSAQDGVWEYGPVGTDADFVALLLEQTSKELCLDLDRIYFVGMSLGAWKAAVTACHSMPGEVRGLALVTVELFPGDCEPIPVIAFHGTADTVVAYGEGGGSVDAATTPNPELPGTLASMAAWAGNADCDIAPDFEVIARDVEYRVYKQCRDDMRVELFTIIAGHHVWPGADPKLYGGIPVTQSIHATERILDFFDEHK